MEIRKILNKNFHKLKYKNFSSNLTHSLTQPNNDILNLKSFLIDNYSRMHNYLRISLTERCNLRCQYCMPDEGIELTPNKSLLSRSELIKLVNLFTKAGVDKVRLTGGEPTIRKDLCEIIQEIKSIPEIKSIGMTTNGIVLKNKLNSLKEAGLDSINISLDTLVEAKFSFITRRLGFQRVLEVRN